MKTYLVGGAVRDKLLNIPIKDRDWVVVGASVRQMLDNNYQQVGKDFPVFIHPTSKEEYALARTERKSGKGYTGFTVHASPEVTLEEDLLRRDLTINAIAEDHKGQLIDPYHGQQDISNKLLRHVSPAFSEDPLRVLRVARFAARFAHLGFTIATETQDLMKDIVRSGEMQSLTAERVWQEIQRALTEKSPQVFFQVLKDCHALAEIIPELDNLFGVPQPEKHHPEIDTGIHTLMVLEQASKLSSNPAARFAALVHDLGKAATPKEKWPSHKGHETLGKSLIQNLSTRLKVPNEYRELGILVSLHHTACHSSNRAANTAKPPAEQAQALLDTLENTDAFRRPERFVLFLIACEADARGRLGLELEPYPQNKIMRNALSLTQNINPQQLVDSGVKGPEIGIQLKRLRLAALTQSISSNKL